jgi:hypothetical protein
LSPIRTLTAPRSFKLRLAVHGSALALLAIAGGIAGTLPASAGQSAATAGRTGPVSLRSGPTSFGASPSITLDAYSAPGSGRPLFGGGAGGSGSGKARRATPKQIARGMLRHFHWSTRQFPYLNRLWARESGWNVHALNPYSGAAGIPQAVPGSKMASAGPNWRNNAKTQIRWGLRYIRDRYGSPRAAWDHEASVGWY